MGLPGSGVQNMQIDPRSNHDYRRADIAGRNPNVFLELGLAFGLGKMFILVTQSVNDMSFDVRTFNVIVYASDTLDNLHSKIQTA
jgi:hypothetical protein